MSNVNAIPNPLHLAGGKSGGPRRAPCLRHSTILPFFSFRILWLELPRY